MRKILLAISMLFMAVPCAFSLAIDPNGSGGTTYVVSWTDQYNKPRLLEIRKASQIAPHMQYYDESGNLVNVAGGNGIGRTVHHNGGFGSGGTTVPRYQGAHVAMFDFVQYCDSALECIRYVIMDGHDYFQWQETVDTRLNTVAGDSRSPYTEIDYNGVDATCATNVDYAMNGNFSFHVTSVDYGNLIMYGNWSQTGYITWAMQEPAVDIPYCREQSKGKEIGYIQTQTYLQQHAGDNTWYGSANQGINCNPSGIKIRSATNAQDFDTQMNFFDDTVKITWGNPPGFMSHGVNQPVSDAINRYISGDIGMWGQYSLSIMLDTVSQGGVMRVRNENRAVQSNFFTISAPIGTMKLRGPVGTSNVNNFTNLVPAGWDQNYRTWWVYPNAGNQVKLAITANNGSSYVNPTFRIRNMSAIPSSVQFNGATLLKDTDYYVEVIPDATSLLGTTNEVWLTLKKNVTTGTLSINTSKISILNAASTPSLITNNASHVVVFTLKAKSAAGNVTNVLLNLSSVGGPASVKMTNISGQTSYRYAYNVLLGVSPGIKSLGVSAYDNATNINLGNSIQLTVTIPPKLTVTNFTTVPSNSTITNDILRAVQFNVKAISATGTVTNVSLDLTSIGGAIVKMNNISGATSFQYSYNVPAGFPAVNNQGLPTIVRDTIGFQNVRTNFHLTIRQGIIVTNFAVAPGIITNNIIHVVVFNLKATSGVGAISSVSIDLSQAGGSAGVSMTNISGATLFRYAYAVTAGLSTGTKSMPITAFDSTGKQISKTVFQLNVIAALVVTNLTTVPATVTNDADHVVVFSLNAISKVGTVTNVSLDLTQVGGSAGVKMTNISGATLFRYAYTVVLGTANGAKTIGVQVFDNTGIQNSTKNFALAVALPSKVLITNFTVVPVSFSNTASHVVVFNAKVKSTIGTLTNVSLNLVPIGGLATVKMTNISGSTQWRYSYKVAINYAAGLKSIFVKGQDSLGNSAQRSNAVTIFAPPPPPVLKANTFEVIPNPLILSGSQQNTPMIIFYNTTKSAKVTFEIFNLTGSVVKTIQGNTAKKLVWTGVNDKGLTVASGTYFLIMKVNGTIEDKPLKIGVLK